MVSTPPIYDIANDAHAARFGLQPWERDHMLTRCFKGRNGGRVEAIVFHIQAGTTKGSLDWWVHGPGVQASSTILIQQDGSLLRCIPERDGPWTNGDVDQPSAKSAYIRGLGGNPNNWVVTVELEGQPWSAVTEGQMNALVWWTLDVADRYGWDLDDDRRFLGHRDFNSINKINCGLYRDAVMARARAERGGTAKPRPGNYGQTVAFSSPLRVAVTSSIAANIRRWGDTDAPIMGELEPGAEFFANGFVYGDEIEGEGRWYIMCGPGYRLWAGATSKVGLP